MSFKFKKIDFNNSKEISRFYEYDIENCNKDDEKINKINNSNLTGKIGNQFKQEIANGDEDEVDKVDFDSSKKNNIKIVHNYDKNNENESIVEGIYKNNYISNRNEAQFYELNTNKLVDIIKNDYNNIYIKQNEEVTIFVDKLAKENTLLKIMANNLHLDISKLKTQNEYYKKLLVKNQELELINETNYINKNKQIKLNLEIHEKEKENIKNEYESILLNNPSSLILKHIKSLYTQLIKCKDDLYNTRKIAMFLQEEIDKLKEKNEYINSHLDEEKNKIIGKIIEIQEKVNKEIELNKNMIINNINNSNDKSNIFVEANNNEEKISNENRDDKYNLFGSNNNPYLFYIDKIKDLTYEKNKLLSCNYDFFVKINDLTQTIEEKNSIINNQIKKNGNLESELLKLEKENKIIKLKFEETDNLIKELQAKNSEIIKKREENVKFDLKLMENKYNIMKSQYEYKIMEIMII